MEPSSDQQEWILLIHQLPPKPTNLRVRIWRKLQKLGAISIKNSVYVLPFNEKTYEDFQWLKQEIESSGGEATVLRAASIEGATDEEIIAAFQKQRDAEYGLVTADLDALTGAIRKQKRGGSLSVGRIKSYEAELDKLYKELDRVTATDFFSSPKRPAALMACKRCHTALRASQDRSKSIAKPASSRGPLVDPAKYQGRRWVTRPNLFIDRLAAIWLIKRFIDKRPRFSFVSEGESTQGAIAFDMYDAEFTHRGEDCTFETIIKHFGLDRDPALSEIAEIVHDIDLKDGKFNRLEAPGINAAISGLVESLKDDRKLIQQCGPIFDGLYELMGQKDKAKKGEPRGGKRKRSGDKRSKWNRRK